MSADSPTCRARWPWCIQGHVASKAQLKEGRMARGAPHLGVGATREQAVTVRMGQVERLRRYGLSRTQLAWLFFLPAVLVLLGTDGYPAARTVWMSLHTIRLDEPWLGEPFVGLTNYGRVLHDANFWGSFGV